MRASNKGKVVVITGASSGIGRETALELAEEEAKLVLVARRESALQSLALECQARGGQALVMPGDVSDIDGLESIAQGTVEVFGRLDAWVNNAGVFCVGRLEETPEDVFRKVLEVNVLGVVNGCRAALPFLRRQGFGTLVNVSSVYGIAPGPYVTAYAASKFAVRGFSESLREELRGTGVEVCTVFPASIDTPLWHHAANYAGFVAQPIRPVYSPQRVARSIRKLLVRPRREKTVGPSGRLWELLFAVAPNAYASTIRKRTDHQHFKPEASAPTPGNVFLPVEEGTGVTTNPSFGVATGPGAPLRRVLALPLVAVGAALALGRRRAHRVH